MKSHIMGSEVHPCERLPCAFQRACVVEHFYCGVWLFAICYCCSYYFW